MGSDFGELSRLVREKGLLERQNRYYAFKIISTLGLFLLGIFLLLTVHHFGLKLLIAVYLAFVYVQVSFIGHDAGHQQVFKSSKYNDILGLFFGTFLLGISRGYWVNKHNAHHRQPNRFDTDPDIKFPIFAFSEGQAVSKRGVQRFMVKYQAFFFLPFWLLEGFAIRGDSIHYLITHKVKYRLIDALLMATHLIGYTVLIFSLLPIGQAFLFILIHQALFGLYLSSVFAPNHKGMPINEKNAKIDFIHEQVLTARNVKANPLTDFWYGGLNYQIEHHLFPTTPRNKLGELQKIVRSYCQEHNIHYYETGMLQSYKEIFVFLHGVSAVVRKSRSAP